MNQAYRTREQNKRSPLQAVVPLLATAGLGFLAMRLWQQRRRSLSTDLTDQVALITGASRGLGLLLAHEFARSGCRLVICARNGQELAWAQKELEEAGAEVVAIACDVADQSQVNHLVREAMIHYGRIDILVNNAGIIDVGPLQNTTLADFKQALDVMYCGML